MELELTRIFVKIIQAGSFTKAAEILKLPKSTVSKALTRLESETGTRLLVRTTRSQTLTASGKAYYETCLQPLQTIEEAQKSLYGRDSIVSGLVKMTAPEDLGFEVIAPAIGELSRLHPKLYFELNFTNEVVDLVRDGYDLAIRLGALSESRLKAKRVGEVTLVLVASPSYIKSSDKVKKPTDVSQHSCLSISSESLNQRWTLKNKKQTVHVSINPKIDSNQVTSLLKLAISGAGIAFLPHFLCRKDLEEGHLQRVLPEWSGMGFPISLVSPLSMAATARLRLVSDYLTGALQKALF